MVVDTDYALIGTNNYTQITVAKLCDYCLLVELNLRFTRWTASVVTAGHLEFRDVLGRGIER